MDIINIIGNNRKYTFHSHTQFCDGHATMDDFARAAIEQGFTHYGFSPHSPIPIASPCNMSRKSVEDYLAEFRRIRDVYGDRVNFYAGMEIDYIGKEWGPSIDYFQSLPLDFRIGSVHFIPDQSGNIIDIDGSYNRFNVNMAKHFGNDIRYVVETYYNESAALIEAGGFDILGHFDKVAQNASVYCPDLESKDWYVNLVNNIIDLIITHKPIVEINTKAKVKHGRIFPNERYLPRLIAADVPLIVNSDAHDPALIDASRQYAFELIDSIKYPSDHASAVATSA